VQHGEKIVNIEEELKKIDKLEKLLRELNSADKALFADKINSVEKELHTIKLQNFNNVNNICDFSLPQEWTPQNEYLKLDVLNKNSNDYTLCESIFKKTLNSSTLVSITRIQNTELWKNYCFAKYQLKTKGNSEEKMLFHGTRTTDPKLIYEGKEEGFDMRFAQDGMWGRAIYFHTNASFSNDFRFTTNSRTNIMLLAKVLVGNIATRKNDSSLRFPPFLENSKKDRYDSIKSNFDERYMIYNNLRAYPAFIIEYK